MEDIFPKVDKISLLDAEDISFGQTTDQTRVPGQKVHKSCRATPRTRQEYQLKRFTTLDLTVGLCLNFYRSFKRLVSLASQ